MKPLRKLPDSEFELMKIVWANPSPISTNQIMNRLPKENDWKPQTVLTLLTRLIERGFLQSERAGRERLYTPLITREEYIAYESGSFMARFHNNSFASLVSALFAERQISDEDLDALKEWLDSRE